MKRNFIDRFQEESINSEFWSKTNRKAGIALASAALLAVILINTTGCTQSKAPEPALPQDELSKESINFGNDGVNAGIAPDVITGGKDAISDKTVALTVADSGRADPFLPEMGYMAAGSSESFDIVAPLETIT
ncbi:MAG: hypothetical protein LBJ74_02290, partial [Heliobacteriaceae bacterium]|nr:hypothetical protein [Heliobacteriaceae bacterium]